MTKTRFDAWLEAYGRAWRSRDPEAAASLFTSDATYSETPFGEPAIGHEGIRRYWAENTEVQIEIAFSHEILALSGDRGIARWWAEYTRLPKGTRAGLDGIFLLDFADDGRCRSLLEWWHRRER